MDTNSAADERDQSCLLPIADDHVDVILAGSAIVGDQPGECFYRFEVFIMLT